MALLILKTMKSAIVKSAMSMLKSMKSVTRRMTKAYNPQRKNSKTDTEKKKKKKTHREPAEKGLTSWPEPGR